MPGPAGRARRERQARVLLSYIFEEVLDWSIMRDGIEGLREAHRKAFKAYLRHGVAIEKLQSQGPAV